MSPLLWAVFLGMLLVALLSVLSKRFASLKRSYFLGVTTWGNWLPVLATGLYLALLVVNLLAAGELANRSLSLGPLLNLFEMTFLLMVGPLFLSRWGNLLATGVLVYFAARLFEQVDAQGAAAAPHLILAATTIVAVLGDKMPWHPSERSGSGADRVRDFLLMVLSSGALSVLAMGLIRYVGFTRWFNVSFGAALPPMMMLGVLAALLIAWLTIALGITRHFMLPLVTLPTALVLAYVSHWSTLLIIVPFIASLAISLTTADQRAELRRRQLAQRRPMLAGR